MDPNNPLIHQKMAIPQGSTIAPIQTKGPAADMHAMKHAAKLQKNVGDCGIDLVPCGINRVEQIESKSTGMLAKLGNQGWYIFYVSTGVHMTICAGAFLFVTPRSSTAMLVPSAEALTGIIDAGYTGELLLRFKCHASFADETKAFIEQAIAEKKALAQAIPIRFCYPQFMMITEGNLLVPPGMGRGSNGFGSTDKQ